MDNDVVKGSFQHDNLATLGRTTGTCILDNAATVHSDSISVAAIWTLGRQQYNYTIEPRNTVICTIAVNRITLT